MSTTARGSMGAAQVWACLGAVTPRCPGVRPAASIATPNGHSRSHTDGSATAATSLSLACATSGRGVASLGAAPFHAKRQPGRRDRVRRQTAARPRRTAAAREPVGPEPSRPASTYADRRLCLVLREPCHRRVAGRPGTSPQWPREPDRASARSVAGVGAADGLLSRGPPHRWGGVALRGCRWERSGGQGRGGVGRSCLRSGWAAPVACRGGGSDVVENPGGSARGPWASS